MFERKACMYLRLSKEDGENNESNSIANQRKIIEEYARKQGLILIKEFVDDGYTGANFERPGFQEMIQKAKEKEFDTIIVKDLSRFGRDYIGAGKYIQKIFPEMKIRFISINDNYDSEKADMNDTHLILPIRNFINDSYCRDISMKVKSAQQVKREKGEYIGAFAPYGYQKNPDNKNQLIIDPKAAVVVKRIFTQKLKGYSSDAIAKQCNALGIPAPAKHKKEEGVAFHGGFPALNGGKWSSKAINRILRNRVYIGYLEQGKRKKLNYKSTKKILVDPQNWVVVKDAHEAIVSEEIFQIANQLLIKDVYPKKNQEPDFFAGMLYCKDCGSPMVRRLIHNKKGTKVTYICSNYNKGQGCTAHRIKEQMLKDMIDTTIQQHIAFQHYLLSIAEQVDFNDQCVIRQDYLSQKLMEEKEKYEQMLHCLYGDREEKLLTAEEFQRFRMIYKTKLSDIQKQLSQRQTMTQNFPQLFMKKKKWLETICQGKTLDTVDRLTLVFLVDSIHIGDNKDIHVTFRHEEEWKWIEEKLRSAENTVHQTYQVG